ncbi:hypothetical protein ACS0TY_005889 [Phlomoides rotata]
MAMDDVSKMEFIKRKCIEIKSELLNWNPEMVANTSVPTDTTSVDVGGYPSLGSPYHEFMRETEI